MTLNGVVALILRYFTELCSSKANRVKVVELCRRKKFAFAIPSHLSANTTKTFKARLDKFWHNQDIIIISGHSCKEPEVVAIVYMKNLGK